MSQIPHQTATDRIDPDHYEPSPSTGWRETAQINHARGGYDHEPSSGGAEHAEGAL